MNKKIIGIIIFVVLIAVIVVIGMFKDNYEHTGSILTGDLTNVYVATGGGKEGFIADERVKEILQKKYKLNVVYDSWSNGKTVLWPLIRENVKQSTYGNDSIIEALNKDHYAYTINSKEVSTYDALFGSDQRFYDYYKLSPDKEQKEADRYQSKGGGIALSTPIVIYSWKDVAEKLEAEGIVSVEDGVYYIKDMPKLLNYILEGKKWSDIGLNLYGSINIASTDPVTSSPGATYYGLLLSIMCENQVNEQTIKENLPKLKEFYEKSGYMNNTPADLFERYLKNGMGAYPMIVDYEKSLINFATENPNGFNTVKDDVVVLYPTPTIWNAHCVNTFTDNGEAFYKIFEDEEIGQIAWDKYGFRTGITGGNFDVSTVGISGIPQKITSTVGSLKMDVYNRLINYLAGKEE